LQRALVEEQAASGINQSAVAKAIGVHRSVISRELNGRQDITLGRVAELAWSMGREIDFQLVKPEREAGLNAPLVKPGALSTLREPNAVPLAIGTRAAESAMAVA